MLYYQKGLSRLQSIAVTSFSHISGLKEALAFGPQLPDPSAKLSV
jgi:hypothetical protein